jgi:hypothetical protein
LLIVRGTIPVIQNIWVIDRISGRCLFERSYGKKVEEGSLIPGFLSALTSLSDSELEGDRISVLETQGKRWVYRYSDPLIFVVTGAKADPESHLKAQVSYLRDSFVGMYPMLKAESAHEFLKNWTGATSDFWGFRALADQLVGQWSEIGPVNKAAKSLDVLEVYQKILDSIMAKIPDEKGTIWVEFREALSDFSRKLKVRAVKGLSGPKPLVDLVTVDAFSLNYEVVKEELAALLTRLIGILKNRLPTGEAEKIMHSQVIPIMKSEWKRIDVYGLDKVLVSLL